MKGKRKVTKRIAAWLMCLAMVLTTINLPVFTTEVMAVEAQPEVHYIDANGDDAVTTDYTIISKIGEGLQRIELESGTYVVNQDVTMPAIVEIKEGNTVNLVLCDGAKFTVDEMWTDNTFLSCEGTLNIFGQEEGTGELEVKCAYESEACLVQSNGQINLYGGTLVSSFTEYYTNGVYLSGNAILNVQGGTFIARTNNGSYPAIDDCSSVGLKVAPDMLVYGSHDYFGENAEKITDNNKENRDKYKYIRVQSHTHNFANGICTECNACEAFVTQGNHNFSDLEGNPVAYCTLCKTAENPNKCGESAYYVYDEENKTLYIYGSGSIDEYAFCRYESDPDGKMNTDANRRSIAESVEKVIVGADITKIGTKCFYISSVKEISFDEGSKLSTIGEGAFEYSLLAEVELPDSVTAIEKKAFMNSQLKNITVSKNLTVIEEQIFNNTKLESVEIPNNIETVKSGAFAFCSKLSSVDFSSGLTGIENEAFCGCNELSKIVLPEGVTTLGEKCFYNSGISEVTMPSSMLSIGKYSLGYKTGSLLGDYLPDIVKPLTIKGYTKKDDCVAYKYYLDNKPETGWTYEETHTHDYSGQPYVDAEDGLNHHQICTICEEPGNERNHDFSENGTCACGLTQVKWDVIPDTQTVKVIGPEDNADLSNGLVIPDTVTDDNGVVYDVVEIAPYAFGDMWENEDYEEPSKKHEDIRGSLVIGSNVTTIGDFAFGGCDGITGDLIIPDSVTTIGDYAFSVCGFTGTLSLGKNVTSIGFCSFSDLYTITGNLEIPNSVLYIGPGAFTQSSFTGDLIIPGSIEVISDGAFADCTGFKGNLTMLDGVTTIGESAFARSGFTGKVTIPNSVTSIGNYAFSNCGFTEELEIPNSVTTIGDIVFAYCRFGISIPCFLPKSAVDDYYSGTVTQRNHDFSKYQPNKAATCKDNATEIGTCICGAEDEREIEGTKLDTHTFVNGVCLVCDKIWKVTENGITYKAITEEKDGKPVGVTVSGNDLGAIAVSVVSANTVDESVSNNSVVIAGELTGNGTEQKFIVTKIEKDAFAGSGMNSLVIPSSVTELGENALGNASNVTFEGMNPPAGIASAIKENATIHIPEGSKDNYQIVFNNIQITINETHTHKFAEEWSYDKNNHWKASACGHDETVVKLTHTFGDWTIVKEATETEEGSKKRICACGYEETEAIAKLEVKPSDKPADVKPSESPKPSDDVKPSESPKPSADVKPSEQPKLTKQTITVAKAAKKTVTFKASKLKAKKATVKLGAKAKTKLSYKVTKYPKNAKKYISVSSKGVVTMKKGAKKGTYKVTITAKADQKYAKATKVITIKVK